MASAPLSSAIPRARAIKYRQENQEAVGGFFSQIGELYVVHHLWGRLGTLQELSAGPLSPLSLRIDNANTLVPLWSLHSSRGTQHLRCNLTKKIISDYYK